MNVELLSRVQFGFSIGFHILFPTLNLGLALFLVIMEAVWVKTRNPLYLKICQFWTKIFALTFGMGVVSGIVLAYQIGTNFGPFITQFGNVLGALFAYETLTAFFLEAGFLGIMVFGWKKVPPQLHFIATLLVAIGTSISAFWIMSANSWMQTPSGYEVIQGKYLVDNWWHVVFNPSFIPRFIHMLLASYVTTCFVVGAVGSYFLLKKSHQDFAKVCLSFSMWAALILVPLQIVVGDVVGLNVYKYQPLKTAAIESAWETEKGVPLILFAIPLQDKEENKWVVEIPKLASLINTHHWDGEIKGLKSYADQGLPKVASVFFSFRIMVAIGLLFLGTAGFALLLRYKDKLYTSKRFHQWCLLISPLGFIASITGWLTAELGRQPWVVYNLLKTENAISNVGAEEVLISFILLIIVYGVIFSFYLYYLLKFVKNGLGTLNNQTIDHVPFQYMSESTEETQ